MIIPDANLLIYAYDEQSRFHLRAKSWFQELLAGEDEVGLLTVVIFGFLRITTNPRIYSTPFTLTEAEGYIRSWLAEPGVKVLETGMEEVEKTFQLLESVGTAGNLVTDAQIAAAAICREAIIHTCDTHFLRFPEVRWHNPILASGRG